MSFTELFKLLVLRHKVMTMAEFYAADIFDLDLCISNLDEVERDASERMRMLMWAVLAPYSKKKQSPEDIVKFSWENKPSEKVTTTKEQFEKMFGNYKSKMNYGKQRLGRQNDD